MKISHSILALLFVAQLLVAGGLYYTGTSKAVVRPEGALVEYESTDIDRIEIEDPEGKIVLARTDDSWVLPDYGDVAALQGKVDSLLDSLNGVKTGWAVATRAASHQQLEVADDNFMRRVIFSGGKQVVAEVYVGTSPGLRRSHARQAGKDEVYAIAINSYDLPAETSQWLSRDLLATDADISVSVSGSTLVPADDNWLLKNAEGAEQVADKEPADAFVNAIKTLSVLDVVSEAPDNAEETVIETVADDKTLVYTFLASDDNSFFVRRNDIDALFSVSETVYENIPQVTPEQLLPDAPEEEAENPEVVEESEEAVTEQREEK